MKKNDEFVIAIDVGSTFLKCEIFDKKYVVRSRSEKKISISMPKYGYHELDPQKLWSDFQEAVKACLKDGNLSLRQISGIGISVQRNSFLLWDRKNSNPLTPIISWQDNRSANCVKSWNESWRLKILNYSSKFAYLLTGNNRFFAASILNFNNSMVSIRLYDLLKSNPRLSQRARAGDLCYGCIETWLLWCLTKGKEFSTDVSCASSTGIYDPFTCKWSDTLLNLLNLPREILPQVKNTDDGFGETSSDFLDQGISVPICCVIGDSQAATIGVGCYNKGEGKVTLGTGSFLTINTGSKAHVSMTGLYPVVGYKIGNKVTYYVEGFHPSTGTTIEWLKQLGFFKSYDELEDVLKRYSTNDILDVELYFVPAFTGLQVPVNDPSAAGLLIGLSPTTLKDSIIYAVMEAIPMSIRWILDEVQKETGIKLKTIRVNGGVSKSKWILQRLADVTNYQVEVCDDYEASCSGAAFLAGVKSGFWKLNQMNDMPKICNVFWPNENLSEFLESRFIKWKSACSRATNWK